MLERCAAVRGILTRPMTLSEITREFVKLSKKDENIITMAEHIKMQSAVVWALKIMADELTIEEKDIGNSPYEKVKTYELKK